MKNEIVYASILGRTMRCEVVTEIRIFPNGRVERGNGKPGYAWHETVRAFPRLAKHDGGKP
jgi:hypothetical protein